MNIESPNNEIAKDPDLFFRNLEKRDRKKNEFIAEKLMGYQRIPKEEINKWARILPMKNKYLFKDDEEKYWKSPASGILYEYVREVPDYIGNEKDNVKLIERIKKDYSIIIYNVRNYWVASIYSKDRTKHLASGWYITFSEAIVNAVYCLLTNSLQTSTQREINPVLSFLQSFFFRIFITLDEPEKKFLEFKRFNF